MVLDNPSDPTGPIDTKIQDIPFLPGIIDFVKRTGDKTTYTFKKGIKLTIKPKRIYTKKDTMRKNPIKEIPVATERSKIVVKNGGENIDHVELIEWRQQGKTSKKRSFGTGTRVLIQTT